MSNTEFQIPSLFHIIIFMTIPIQSSAFTIHSYNNHLYIVFIKPKLSPKTCHPTPPSSTPPISHSSKPSSNDLNTRKITSPRAKTAGSVLFANTMVILSLPELVAHKEKKTQTTVTNNNINNNKMRTPRHSMMIASVTGRTSKHSSQITVAISNVIS